MSTGGTVDILEQVADFSNRNGVNVSLAYDQWSVLPRPCCKPAIIFMQLYQLKHLSTFAGKALTAFETVKAFPALKQYDC